MSDFLAIYRNSGQGAQIENDTFKAMCRGWIISYSTAKNKKMLDKKLSYDWIKDFSNSTNVSKNVLHLRFHDYWQDPPCKEFYMRSENWLFQLAMFHTTHILKSWKDIFEK